MTRCGERSKGSMRNWMGFEVEGRDKMKATLSLTMHSKPLIIIEQSVYGKLWGTFCAARCPLFLCRFHLNASFRNPIISDWHF